MDSKNRQRENKTPTLDGSCEIGSRLFRYGVALG